MGNQTELYQRKTLDELIRIQPKWAYGINLKKALNYFQDQLLEGYKIYLANPSQLIEHAEMYEVSKWALFTGNDTNDGRIAKILSRWDSNDYVDPPTIGLNYNNEICFSDGRHRAKLSYFLKHNSIPVAIHLSDVCGIKKILDISKN